MLRSSSIAIVSPPASSSNKQIANYQAKNTPKQQLDHTTPKQTQQQHCTGYICPVTNYNHSNIKKSESHPVDAAYSAAQKKHQHQNTSNFLKQQQYCTNYRCNTEDDKSHPIYAAHLAQDASQQQHRHRVSPRQLIKQVRQQRVQLEVVLAVAAGYTAAAAAAAGKVDQCKAGCEASTAAACAA
jgi:hypothetical protein